MISLTGFLRDLFCLAHAHECAGQAGDGRGFEQRVARHLATAGVRPAEVFSGVRSLGSVSLSGLYHQIDSTAQTREAIVIGEWKAHRGTIPKNELLRFKAATDDYWLRRGEHAISPVIRVFGGTGSVTPAMRRYAAQWGICLVTPQRWPSPLLVSDTTLWPDDGPEQLARRHVAWLCRPLESVCAPGPGGWTIPKVPDDATIDHFLALQDRWSDVMWRRFATLPGGWSGWLRKTVPAAVAA